MIIFLLATDKYNNLGILWIELEISKNLLFTKSAIKNEKWYLFQ